MAKKEPTVDQLNIKVLLKSMCQFKNDLSAPLIDDTFQVPKTTLKVFQKTANIEKTLVNLVCR